MVEIPNTLPNELQTMLREFIVSFRASLDPRLWANLIREEKAELQEALEEKDQENILKEATDLMYVTIGFNLVSAGSESLNLFHEDERMELMDLLREGEAVYGKAMNAVPARTDFFEAFVRVHRSNMSKLGDDGNPIKREDGKVLKGPNYKKPELRDLIE